MKLLMISKNLSEMARPSSVLKQMMPKVCLELILMVATVRIAFRKELTLNSMMKSN